MSPARAHRERHQSAARPSTPIVPRAGGDKASAPVTPPSLPLSPARQHRIEHALAAPAPVSDAATPAPAERDTLGAQIMLRLTADLRRLKEIASVARKIAAKVEMLPEYRAWCDAVLASERAPEGVAAEVLPTVMVWAIDVGDWSRALELAAFVLRHAVPLPGRYVRSAPALVTEEIAAAALKLQAGSKPFPLDVLEEVEALTADADMHDEIRAKLHKAIGFELGRQAEAAEGDAARPLIADALAALGRAQQLNDRINVKTRVTQLTKAMADNLATFPPAGPEGESESSADTNTNAGGNAG